MATIDVQGKTASVETWLMEHGAAAALVGCFGFWVLFGVTIYLAAN